MMMTTMMITMMVVVVVVVVVVKLSVEGTNVKEYKRIQYHHRLYHVDFVRTRNGP